MIRLGLVLVALLILSGATCQNQVVPVIVEPGDTAKCPAACGHLRALGCPEGQPLEDGTSCEKFCQDTQKNGQPLAPACILTIKECSQIETCTQAR